MKVALFLEDIAHLRFFEGLIRRIANEMDPPLALHLDVRNARGGKGQMKASFQAFLRNLDSWMADCDFLIVAQDTDCVGVRAVKQEIHNLMPRTWYKPLVVAAPDPCIEAWYLADQEAVRNVAQAHSTPPIPSGCDGNALKTQLGNLFREGGVQTLLGGIEYAEAIVANMDLYRAAHNVPSLDTFISDLRAALRASTA